MRRRLRYTAGKRGLLARFGLTVVGCVFTACALVSGPTSAQSTEELVPAPVSTVPACVLATTPACAANAEPMPADAPQAQTANVPLPVALVWQDLAMQLNIAPTDVQVQTIEEVVWPDTCLGLPSPELCIFGETPGYRVILSTLGREYTYHTDQNELFRFAGPGDSPARP